MATNTTYDTLLGDLGVYIEKSRIVGTTVNNQLPRIVNKAERGIITDLKLQGYESTIQGETTEGVAIYPKPDGWRETLSMHILAADGMTKSLFPRGYEYLQVFAPDSTILAEPSFYCDHGPLHWMLAFTPDATYQWQIKFYRLPTLLASDNQENWLTQMLPDVLLSRCLKEVAMVLGKFDDAAFYESEYGKAIGAHGAEDGKKLMDRAAERDGV